MGSWDDEKARLKSLPCQCVRCDLCQGLGSIDDPLDYSGTYPRTCPDCNGQRLLEVCERCVEVEDMYRQEDEERDELRER